jgi:fructose-1,6-bisphosphatase I/sedoheptulose-1,7-bisphosphatase/fructose-1,6-bisphosphatase I
MAANRMTLSKFLIEQLQDQQDHGQLAALLVDITAAIKAVAAMTAKGALGGYWGRVPASGTHGSGPMKLEVMAHEEIQRSCEWGGQLAGMISRRLDRPHSIPPEYKRGRYLLLFDPLGASTNFDLNASVGTVFSVLPHRSGEPKAGDYLRPGRELAAAGYAIYGPATMLVLTVGKGTHGFTLDREIGNFILTHSDLRIPEDTAEFAIDMSNERFWEPPVQRYVAECKAGAAGAREREFNMRWIASMVADVHRVLMRGGVFMDPRGVNDPPHRAGVRLLYEAGPLAFIVEQAGGCASTGRDRLLEVEPAELMQLVPAILGSKNEVERVARYHREFDEGTDKPYDSPLFKERSLFRDEAPTRGS